HLLSTLRQTFLRSDLHSRLQATQGTSTSGAASPPEAPPEDRGPGRPEKMRTFEFDFESPHGSSLGRLELSGGPSDRQTVASWFESSGAKHRFPDSLGEPSPPPWAGSLPLGSAVGPAGAFDEFSPAGAQESALPARKQPATEAPAVMPERRSA